MVTYHFHYTYQIIALLGTKMGSLIKMACVNFHFDEIALSCY